VWWWRSFVLLGRGDASSITQRSRILNTSSAAGDTLATWVLGVRLVQQKAKKDQEVARWRR
jgi:hypothetical protein